MLINHFNSVVRLYDAVKDNPVEVTVGRPSTPDNVELVIVDRDAGSELSITLNRMALEVAIALTQFGTVCEDCRTAPPPV